MNVVGLTGKEPVIIMGTQTFCSLCKKVVRRGDEAVASEGRRGSWFIHPDCARASILDNHSKWFHQQEVKRKDHPERTRVQKRKIRISNGMGQFCSFCKKSVEVGDTYVKAEGKCYHNSGRNSCFRRYRAVNNQAAWALR